MLKLITALSVAIAFIAIRARAEDDDTPTTPTVNVSRNLTVNYPDGCDDGFGPIVIELQTGTEFYRFVVACAKVIDD